MMRKRNIIAVILLACFASAGAVVFVTYQGTDSEAATSTSIRLKWLDQAQFAGYYWAEQEDLYKDKGLDVSLFPGGPDISPMQMVVNGTNDFGVIGADQLLLAREKGLPVVAVAVIYQDTSVSFASLKKSDIKSPADLEGKKVAIAYGRDEEVVYKAMLENVGVERNSIEESPLNPGLSQLVSGTVDSQMVYETNEPVLFRQEGHEVDLIKARDYGVNFYADTLFTTEKMIEENPELVAKVVEATITGWEKSFADTSRAAEITKLQNKNLDVEVQKRSLELSKPLIFNDGNIGISEVERWQEMEDILISQGVMKKKVDLTTVFTNEFLE